MEKFSKNQVFDIFKKKKPFIVSCQALEHEYLYGEHIMLKMAEAAIDNGADMIRTSQLHNINDMVANLNVPLIAIIKKVYQNNDVFITPTIKEVEELINTNAHIIATDATLRKRPKESLEQIVAYFQANKKDHQLLMADCSTLDDIKNAIKLGFDFIGTTLRGYTYETLGISNTEHNYEFLKEAKKLCASSQKCLLIAEGGFNTPLDAQQAYLHGADALVVGSAITRPDFITKQFYNAIKDVVKKE
ncbi:N-acetylmannosamine-6-phosphate 2-epimerase [Mycoplasmopsis alligatoris]|uniref:Putative N-acetylmannosamine-6-phosphate 2-epimerase n=1 Tax=Mycoplasmopsis alligatoris A21JP2 TaxID=747682 RepID=D4XVE5_9BACT|nr:N-acetylmannosamine-6-phosphate 2-epimerase [Mycoplasmopsis alligatoris]EFF41716.1 N-acetylmannosamine-6-P epimerase family protein [Mycoplasmopsis alligatoris A21JP2]